MAKRVTSTAVNWQAVIQKFIPEDRVKLSAFKAVLDKYLREISMKPAELPKIDWNLYKSRISTPGMVETYKSSYEALKIPYPSDQGLLAEAQKYNESFLKEKDEEMEKVKSTIAELQKELEKIENRMPYAQMTMEEFFLARPDLKIDPDNPRLWPQHFDDSIPPEGSK